MAEANNSPSAPPLYNPGNHYFIEGDKLHDRPTSAYSPDSSPPQSDEENLDCSKEENLSSQREDLITKFQELRERLDRKQKYMIDCLDDTAIHNETEDLRKQLEHLYMTRRNLEKDMKDPELAHALNVPCRVVDDQICRIEKMYSKWLMDKKLAYMKRTADKMTSESAALADVERKQNIQEEKAEKNFREWTKAKKSEKERTDNMRQLQLERERENRQLARLKAAEAYEQWLIQHPHKILPTPSFINPQAWDN